MSVQERKQALIDKTFRLMLRILVIFGAPAVAAYFTGKWLDTTYGMRPYGSLIAIAAALILSWTITIRMYLNIDREFRALREEEEIGQSEKEKNPNE